MNLEVSTPTWKLQSVSKRICREGDILLDIYSAVLSLHTRLDAIEASLQGVPYIQHQATPSCFSTPSGYHGQSSSACICGSSGTGSVWAPSTIPVTNPDQSSSACTSGSSGTESSSWQYKSGSDLDSNYIPMELHTAAEPDVPYAQQGSGSTVQVHGGWAPSTGPIPIIDTGLSGSSHPLCKERETDMCRKLSLSPTLAKVMSNESSSRKNFASKLVKQVFTAHE